VPFSRRDRIDRARGAKEIPTLDLFLIRHAESEGCTERLVGRTPQIGLTARGRAQAVRLPARLRECVDALDAIYSSPLRRAIETAAPLGVAFGILPQPLSEFTEVDFGIWTGRSFTALDGDDTWKTYNAHRSVALIPGGESVAALRLRIFAAIRRLLGIHQRGAIAIVTHAEIVRVIALEYCGHSLDDFHTVAIEPASITAVRFRDGVPEVRYVNRREEEQTSPPSHPARAR
jgi:broad specificity phosphatase PhoE